MVERYEVELDEKRHPRLVARESVEYAAARAKDPEAVAEMLNTCFKLNRMAEEHLYMIGFSSSCEPLGVFEVSHGSVRESLSGKREIFLRAALCGAVYIIVAHNHPSGDVTPSAEDKKTAIRLKEFGQMMEIRMLDFIIVGGKDFCSFSREGLM